jgi:hypothetical protein
MAEEPQPALLTLEVQPVVRRGPYQGRCPVKRQEECVGPQSEHVRYSRHQGLPSGDCVCSSHHESPLCRSLRWCLQRHSTRVGLTGRRQGPSFLPAYPPGPRSANCQSTNSRENTRALPTPANVRLPYDSAAPIVCFFEHHHSILHTCRTRHDKVNVSVTPVRFFEIKADRGNLGPVMEDMWILIAMALLALNKIVHPCVTFCLIG